MGLIQEMCVSGQHSWRTHTVLTHNAPTDACDAICISGTIRKHSPASGEDVCKQLTFSDDSTRVIVTLKNKHTDS